MGDSAGDGGVGGHERNFADPLRPERALGVIGLNEVDLDARGGISGPSSVRTPANPNSHTPVK